MQKESWRSCGVASTFIDEELQTEVLGFIQDGVYLVTELGDSFPILFVYFRLSPGRINRTLS